MFRPKLLLVIFIVLFLSVSVLAQTRRALVIGLGEQQDKTWCKINGDRDVPLVCRMLRTCGYKSHNIRTLVNHQATKAGIVDAFRALAQQCHKGDVVYVHFSGHGQLVTDVDGDDKNALALEESWIPYDACFRPCANDMGEKHLIDDEINTLLGNVADKIGSSGRMLVAVDACHSEGSTLGGIDEETAVRGLSEDGDTAIFTVSRGLYGEFMLPFTFGHAPQGCERWLTLSACGIYEQNQEVNDVVEGRVGKLTFALYCLVKKGHADKTGIVRLMNQHQGRMPQNPQFSGDVRYQISAVLR